MGSVLLQIVVPDGLRDAIDQHVEHLQSLDPSVTVTRSSVAREWLERAASLALPVVPKFPAMKRGRPPRV